jgi:hypothetical protein
MERLRLIGHEAEDVPVISALMQDAAVRVEDIAFDARARRFALIANRYCWEKDVPARIRSALRIECVTRAQRKDWPAQRDAVLELLAIRRDGDGMVLDFAGGASVRLETECVDLLLEDLSGPWGARVAPRHET